MKPQIRNFSSKGFFNLVKLALIQGDQLEFYVNTSQPQTPFYVVYCCKRCGHHQFVDTNINRLLNNVIIHHSLKHGKGE